MNPPPDPLNENPTGQSPDDLLMLGLKNGNMEDFRKLYSKYIQTIFRYVYSLCGNRALAEEIAQEAFLKVYRARDGYRPQNQFKSWIFKIAGNLFRDSIRKKRLKEVPFDKVAQFRAECATDPEAYFDPEEKAEIPDCPLMNSVPPKYRELFLLRVVEGLSYAELSDITGTTEQNVRKAISRILQKLREEAKSDGM